jgi:hypothetical protein
VALIGGLVAHTEYLIVKLEDGRSCWSVCCTTEIITGDEFVLSIHYGKGISHERYCTACFNFSPDWVGLLTHEIKELNKPEHLKIDREVLKGFREKGLGSEAFRCFRCKALGHRFVECNKK